MAPVLLCPECGAKHPVDGVGGSAFACKGCGRTLKVPQQVPATAGASKTGAASDPDLPWPSAAPPPSSTMVLPATPPPPTPAPARPRPAPSRRSAQLDPVPGRVLRFGLWIVAVPLGFVIVFSMARVFGMLNSNQLEDVVITEGWGRFMPIVRLLPFVALATAGIVQGAVYTITEVRHRRSRARVARQRATSAR